jgi:exodeoxyribonuclease VII small subunit
MEDLKMPESKDKEMTYEAAMTELRQTVAKLSEGKATLDESLKLYERGVELVGICENKLNEVTARIEAVNKENGTTDPLNISETGV